MSVQRETTDLRARSKTLRRRKARKEFRTRLITVSPAAG